MRTVIVADLEDLTIYMIKYLATVLFCIVASIPVFAVVVLLRDLFR